MLPQIHIFILRVLPVNWIFSFPNPVFLISLSSIHLSRSISYIGSSEILLSSSIPGTVSRYEIARWVRQGSFLSETYGVMEETHTEMISTEENEFGGRSVQVCYPLFIWSPKEVANVLLNALFLFSRKVRWKKKLNWVVIQIFHVCMSLGQMFT